MADTLLTIQHDNKVFSPPVEDDVQIEWNRTGTPGKLTFTTINPSDTTMTFSEGDPVCFYYNNKMIFMGYVFTKSRDKLQKIKVTCYDQLRYFKNKYSYVFENKRADEIIQALCRDFNLHIGTLDNTRYVIRAIAEENTSAFDIILKALEDTLTSTGNMFILYDDAGKLMLKNAENMICTTLIYEDTAENFDYSTSIDEETYNSIVLYYKGENGKIIPYTASNKSAISKWGTLRYFEEVKVPTLGQSKANSLLDLYCRKSRELKIKGAFGAIEVRAGSLIPIKLNLGDTTVNNYMSVESVTHKFSKDKYTMDLTLEGAWDD